MSSIADVKRARFVRWVHDNVDKSDFDAWLNDETYETWLQNEYVEIVQADIEKVMLGIIRKYVADEDVAQKCARDAVEVYFEIVEVESSPVEEPVEII
jgi:hypothetical protein